MALAFVPEAFVVEAQQAVIDVTAYAPSSAASGYKTGMVTSDVSSAPASVDLTGYKTAFSFSEFIAPAASSLSGSPIMVGIGFSISQRPKRPVICYQGIYDANVSATAIWPRCND